MVCLFITFVDSSSCDLVNPGIIVRVALVGIIADHPAMCKLCGFADHSHNVAPCTKCTVPQDKLFSDKALRNGKHHHFLDIVQV